MNEIQYLLDSLPIYNSSTIKNYELHAIYNLNDLELYFNDGLNTDIILSSAAFDDIHRLEKEYDAVKYFEALTQRYYIGNINNHRLFSEGFIYPGSRFFTHSVYAYIVLGKNNESGDLK